MSTAMLAEGVIVGAYRVVRKLGEGGMGIVYIGEHLLLGRKAAIKVLLPELSTRPELVERLFHEAKAVTQIADPGIVQVFDFGFHDDGSAYIVMELLDGETMDRRIERLGRLDPADALRLMRLICASLGAAHAKGVVHRDLKPENIFLVSDPAVASGERVKIVDFGIAKLLGEDSGQTKTRTGVMVGTPTYMSPEQCRRASTVDARSDIYALGCVLMAMLTGRPPFEAGWLADVIAAHLREAPPSASRRVPGLPAVFDQILERCLAKSPDERFQTTAELADAIARADAAGWEAPPRTPPEPALRPPSSAVSIQTTLTGAAGQTVRIVTHRRALLVSVAIATAVIAMIATSAVRRRAAGDRAAAPPSAPRVEPATPVAVEPPRAAAPPEASVAVPREASAAGGDAGVDEVVVPKPMTDLDARPTRPNKLDRKPSPGGNRARSRESDDAAHVDRGD